MGVMKRIWRNLLWKVHYKERRQLVEVGTVHKLQGKNKKSEGEEVGVQKWRIGIDGGECEGWGSSGSTKEAVGMGGEQRDRGKQGNPLCLELHPSKVR